MNGMTIKQIAELCGVGETTVRRWIDAIPSAGIAKPSAETAKATGTPFRFSLADTLELERQALAYAEGERAQGSLGLGTECAARSGQEADAE